MKVSCILRWSVSQLIEKIHLKNSYNTFTMVHINLYHSLIYPFSLSSSTSTCFSAFPTAKIQACKHDKHPNKSKLILNRSGGLRIEHQAVRERTWTKCLVLSLLVDSACHVKKTTAAMNAEPGNTRSSHGFSRLPSCLGSHKTKTKSQMYWKVKSSMPNNLRVIDVLKTVWATGIRYPTEDFLIKFEVHRFAAWWGIALFL